VRATEEAWPHLIELFIASAFAARYRALFSASNIATAKRIACMAPSPLKKNRVCC